MTTFHYGRPCKIHPELLGQRYVHSFACVQCHKNSSSGIQKRKRLQIRKENKELRVKLAAAEKLLKEIKKQSPAHKEAINAFLKS